MHPRHAETAVEVAPFEVLVGAVALVVVEVLEDVREEVGVLVVAVVLGDV